MGLKESIVFYKVLKNIYRDGKSNSIQLDLKHGMSDDKIEQLVLEGVEKGYLDLVKGSEPEEYTVDLERLVEAWYSLWEEESDKVPATPENFDAFLKSYIESYLGSEDNSTIREMLVEEFHIGLSVQESKTYLNNDFRELHERLSNGFVGKRGSGRHIKYGLDHR